MIITINDPKQGAIAYDLETTCTFKQFSNHCTKAGYPLQHVANITSASTVSEYQYSVQVDKDKWSNERGWAYVIVADGKIAKIGMTEVTLSSRFSSYQAGTRHNRNNGTCSVTNWYCSEFIRKCLASNTKLQIYAYKVPSTKTTLKVFNNTTEILNKTAYVYEDAFLNEHKAISGVIPPLCRNSSKI